LASNYAVVSSETVQQLLGTAGTQSVERVYAQAIPSGIVFGVDFPPVIDNPTAVDEILAIRAADFNDLGAQPGVTGVQVIEDINDADQMVERLAITITDPSGAMQQTVESWTMYQYPQPLKDNIAAVVANLTAIKAL
jgi:Ethanolamine utilization protein EutJ (predicted chaperonin)